jgi:lysophospholipase L1-like esterase
MSRVIVFLGKIFFSSALTLGLVEVGLRVIDMQPPMFALNWSRTILSENPVLAYELDPNHEGINSDGLYGPEMGPKRPGVERVMVLGDSIAFGCCEPKLAVEDTFPKRLERILNSRAETGKSYEFINAATNGYNTVQEAELYRTKASSLDPDRLILQFCENDWVVTTEFAFNEVLTNRVQDEATRANIRAYYRRAQAMTRLMSNSFLARQILYQYGRLAGARKEDASDARVSGNWRDSSVVEDGLDRLADAANANDVPVLMVIFPRFRRLFREQDKEQFAHVTRMARKKGFDVLDLTECYASLDSDNLRRFNDGDGYHPNLAGHELAARCIANHFLPKEDAVSTDIREFDESLVVSGADSQR